MPVAISISRDNKLHKFTEVGWNILLATFDIMHASIQPAADHAWMKQPLVSQWRRLNHCSANIAILPRGKVKDHKAIQISEKLRFRVSSPYEW